MNTQKNSLDSPLETIDMSHKDSKYPDILMALLSQFKKRLEPSALWSLNVPVNLTNRVERQLSKPTLLLGILTNRGHL